MYIAELIGLLICFTYQKYVKRNNIRFSKTLKFYYSYEVIEDSKYLFVNNHLDQKIIGVVFGSIITLIIAYIVF